MTRRDQERARLAVAQALLNAGRPLVLAGSPLIEEVAVLRLARQRYAGGVLAEELALGDLVREAGEAVIQRLGDDPRLARERGVLAAVLAGGSVRSASQALGVSREHLSNTAWKTVTRWVLAAFEERCHALRSVREAPASRSRRGA